ncbi:hypothetical protein CP985_03420 [Malaciobacter mytili LMG 24559]|uniref:TraD/TraG TraM recognition site domain-containing protein n=1 Tax=Malaciobacter mytili LMG 24559 TaxID=1032238 RepID=A0AAX2AJV0_9BACT|nr:TraM recognition domain-containing protein [Malaciobacter mytili]AXH16407.1 F-type type IV conjugative transfer system, coupling factor TraD [Malaciobacter mytili LMG 24559]RXK16474.1 hypothetical protein CP985_03420 [Malaciobacter mytili LMG 24559]
MSFLSKYFTSRENIFNEYLKLNRDIMQIVKDIKEIEDNFEKYNIKDFKTEQKLKALQYERKILEETFIDYEKYFYNVKKGLWIGVAINLESDSLEQELLYLPWKNLHNHFEVYGTSGYGKSRLMASMIRQMTKFGWSLMVVDPKGGERQEVAQWVYDFAAEANRNHTVMRIMSAFPDLSDKGNPIYAMSTDEIASLISAIAVPSAGVVSSNDQFYSGQVYRTIKGILTSTEFLEKAAYSKEDISRSIEKEVIKYNNFKEHKNTEILHDDGVNILPDISKISLKDLEKTNVKHMISPFNRTLITFRELAYFSNYDRLVELKQLVEDYPIASLENEFELRQIKEEAIGLLHSMVTKEKAFFEKVGDSLSIILSQIAYGPIGSIMCDIRINPIVQRIRDEEGVIIILQPAPMNFEKISEMMIKIYTRMYLSLYGTIGTSGRGVDRRFGLIVDEAKPMMFPGIEEIYNKARQLGMTIGAFYQSRSDIKFKLGDTLADIVQDNTATPIYMKQGSEGSRKECAESFGKRKVAINVAMKENDNAGGRSTVVYEDRDLVSSSDMDDLGIGEGFIKHYGKKYYVTFPYQKDPSSINVEMPKLEYEELYNQVAIIERRLKSVEKNFIEEKIE